ncbi:hypothetical protein PSAB6_230158 [Paraburkholderia sabiae]|nr:hypothetical protein PSAB6_230158 [Paraburkholderia sabiae]
MCCCRRYDEVMTGVRKGTLPVRLHSSLHPHRAAFAINLSVVKKTHGAHEFRQSEAASVRARRRADPAEDIEAVDGIAGGRL